MRSSVILSVCFLLFSWGALAQQKLPNFISKADKKKVEHAKTLLNKGRVFEGEKILLDLRNENKNQSYFHEALVQVQMQILHKIALETPPDNEEGEYFLQDGQNLLPKTNLADNFINNGLARTAEQKKETVDNIRLSRSDRKKLGKQIEAQASSDTSLNPVEAARREIELANQKEKEVAQGKKESLKKAKKSAKKADDLSLVSYDTYAWQIIANSRKASLLHERVDSASHYLRILTVDTIRYDTMLSQADLDVYAEGLDYYYTRDFRRAAERFKFITDKYDEYFPAHLALANSYLKIGLDTPSYKQFLYVADAFYQRPEGLEGLSRYFLAKGKYKQAAAAVLKAIAIYPEDAYFAHLDRILKRMGRYLNSQWIRREVYPLNTEHNYEEIIAKEKSPWRYYQGAKSMVYSYAQKGILRSNEITNERYLEVYAWKEMLAGNLKLDSLIQDPAKQAEYLRKSNLEEKKSKKKKKVNFPFARSMQKMGYLDCYVFISLFHNDMHDAFKDFVLLNPEKIEKYFYILLNWEDERFDKFRVGAQVKKKKTEEE